MKKEFNIDLIELPSSSVEDLAKTTSFMSAVFGWKYTAWGDSYTDSESGGISHAFNADNDHKPALPMVILFANDLEKTKGEIEKNGGKIVKEIFSFPGGRRFHFIEPSGNLMAVWSDK